MRIPQGNRIANSDNYLQVEEWNLFGRPYQGGLDWNLAKWIKDFPEYSDFLSAAKNRNLGLLDRRTLRTIVAEALKENEYQSAFLIVMVWGFGFRGYAGFRSLKIMNDPDFQATLKKTVDALHAGDFELAYRHLIEDGPNGLGCAFGSKFLHFATPLSATKYPIILDNLINKALNRSGSRSFNIFSINSQKYLEIVSEFHEAASYFQIEAHELEELLFSNIFKESAGGDWSQIGESTLIREEKFAWVMLLATDLERKSTSLKMSRTFPGGGQYDCIRLETFQGLVMELNLNGGIFLHSEPAGRFDWEVAFKLGVIQCSKRLRKNSEDFERAMPNHQSNVYSWLARSFLGKTELKIDNFLEFSNFSEASRDELTKIYQSASFRLGELTLVLFEKDNICGFANPMQGKALDTAGNEISITHDSYIPYESSGD